MKTKSEGIRWKEMISEIPRRSIYKSEKED